MIDLRMFLISICYISRCCGDFCATGRSYDGAHFATCWIDDDGGCHGRQGPFTRFNEINGTRWHSIFVDVWSGKVIHRIVQNNARLLWNKASTKAVTVQKNYLSNSHFSLTKGHRAYKWFTVDVMATAIPLPSRTEIWDVPWSSWL